MSIFDVKQYKESLTKEDFDKMRQRLYRESEASIKRREEFVKKQKQCEVRYMNSSERRRHKKRIKSRAKNKRARLARK